LILSTGILNPSMACTSIFAGKDATADGSVIISRNEDMAGDWSKHFVVHKRENYKEGEMEVFYNGLTVPRPLTGYKYMSLPDWDSSEGPFEAAGINELGVAISATNSAGTLESVKEADPFIETGIGEEHIPTLILQRAKTAKDGISLLGAMIEEYGSTSGYGLAIADENEAWYFEVGSGHNWVAVRVPDDKYIAVSNEFRISKIDLEDTDNYLGKSDIKEFAIKNNFIDNVDDFDFAKVFGTLGKLYNTRREWEVQRILTSSLKQNGNEERYPLFLKPDKKIELKDIMNVLTSRYEDTPYDYSLKGNEDERVIGIDRTMESHIIQLRQDMPVEVGAIMWLAMANPEYSVYLPFYSGITKTPTSYKLGEDKYDSSSAYWAFKSVSSLAMTDEEKLGKGVKTYWGEYQNKLLNSQNAIDKKAIEFINANRESGIEYLNEISNRNANFAVGKAITMRNELMTELAKNSDNPYEPK